MTDEFDVAVDDGSAGVVADQIMTLKGKIEVGDYEDVDRMWAEYKERMERKGVEQQQAMFKRVETKDEDQETDGDDDDDDDEEDEDEEMGDAPALVSRPPRERVEPEVDEDGFTKVVGKKKR